MSEEDNSTDAAFHHFRREQDDHDAELFQLSKRFARQASDEDESGDDQNPSEAQVTHKSQDQDEHSGAMQKMNKKKRKHRRKKKHEDSELNGPHQHDTEPGNDDAGTEVNVSPFCGTNSYIHVKYALSTVQCACV